MKKISLLLVVCCLLCGFSYASQRTYQKIPSKVVVSKSKPISCLKTMQNGCNIISCQDGFKYNSCDKPKQSNTGSVAIGVGGSLSSYNKVDVASYESSNLVNVLKTVSLQQTGATQPTGDQAQIPAGVTVYNQGQQHACFDQQFGDCSLKSCTYNRFNPKAPYMPVNLKCSGGTQFWWMYTLGGMYEFKYLYTYDAGQNLKVPICFVKLKTNPYSVMDGMYLYGGVTLQNLPAEGAEKPCS